MTLEVRGCLAPRPREPSQAGGSARVQRHVWASALDAALGVAGTDAAAKASHSAVCAGGPGKAGVAAGNRVEELPDAATDGGGLVAGWIGREWRRLQHSWGWQQR